MSERRSASLVDECARRSVELLRRNAGPGGPMACTPTARAASRHYDCVFGRDAAICALGMAASGDAELVECARAGLATLARHQADNGQIPNYVHPDTGETDFWYVGCPDATLWWLLAVDAFDRSVDGADLRGELGAAVDRALTWARCQEHPAWGLVQQPEASDWADIMPRSGFVLYTNALWYRVKTVYRLPGAASTRAHADQLLHPFDDVHPGHRRVRLLRRYVHRSGEAGPLYLSFMNFSFWGDEIDVLGNILAALVGLPPPKRARRIVETLRQLEVDRPWPVRVVGRPLDRGHRLWRDYMLRHRQNEPGQYHNGGAWPFAGGFWVLLLARLGLADAAREALERLAVANAAGDWGFHEWFHGRTGAPAGMRGQTWNAALFLLARRAVDGEPDPFS